MKNSVSINNAPKPAGPYSQAIRASRFLFVSGQLAIDPKENRITSSNIKDQTNRVMANIKAILQPAGYSLTDIIQANVYLSSMALFKEFNAEYAKYFDKNPPARATVGAELLPNALVEISIIAYKE
jgi:2-iminobutanoate/2-iminopropanoate deaminase